MDSSSISTGKENLLAFGACISRYKGVVCRTTQIGGNVRIYIDPTCVVVAVPTRVNKNIMGTLPCELNGVPNRRNHRVTWEKAPIDFQKILRRRKAKEGQQCHQFHEDRQATKAAALDRIVSVPSHSRCFLLLQKLLLLLSFESVVQQWHKWYFCACQLP